MTKRYRGDYIDWEAGREGYVDPRRTGVPLSKPAGNSSGRRHLLSILAEERLASLIAAGGMIWAVYVATADYDSLWRMQIMPPGPVEVCALGIVAWLHAKWRRSTKVN